MIKRHTRWFIITGAAAVCWLTTGSVRVLAQPQGPVYGNLRYEDDYSFLNNGEDHSRDPFNRLKKIPVGGHLELTLGGHYRFRFERDANRRFGASNPQSQSFFLNRFFLFADVHVANRVRLFGEFKYASIMDNELPAPLTAHDKPDVQNLFAEIVLVSREHRSVSLRAGRQELQFGKQRLIGPLDWANTRRTFDGIRFMVNPSGWKFDGFVARPVELDPQKINEADKSQMFAGVYGQRAFKGKSVSAYYLLLKEDDPLVKSGNGSLGSYTYHALGLAFDGASKGLDWTTEAAYQFGSFSTDDIGAYMVSLEGGYTLSQVPAKPRVGIGFDIASGDKDPTDAEQQTFNQLFPTGHPFFGWADQVGRQNVKAVGLLFTGKPHQRLVAKLNGFKFFLDQKRDALYNAAGAPTRREATGAAGNDAGTEIDAEVTFNCCVHASLMIGYARFMPGDVIKNTGLSKTHSLFYVMLPVKF